MNEYDIAIRETMEMTVTVEAASREEDRRMVEKRRIYPGRRQLQGCGVLPQRPQPRPGRTMNCFFGRSVFPCGEWNVYVPASIAFVIPQRQLVRGNAP